MRRIEEEYIATGQVRLVYHHNTILGDESVRAAEAAECANEQGRFWDYADTLFTNQRGENRGAFTDANLKTFAEGLGLDTIAFNTCLDQRRYFDDVSQERREAEARAINSTPIFLINGQRITVQRLNFEEFQQPIEAALAAGG